MAKGSKRKAMAVPGEVDDGEERDEFYSMDARAQAISSLRKKLMGSRGTEFDTNAHLRKDDKAAKIANERVSADEDAGASRATASLRETNESAKRDVEVALVEEASFNHENRDEAQALKAAAPAINAINESVKKRSLDLPMQSNRETKRMHTAEEKEKVSDGVCFICFDGGELVLCDRKSCPKVYHLSCIGRDKAFFEKKGAWLCGWHFCSVCTKPTTSFQCYTCPTAFCRTCIAQGEFLTIRGKKGLCDDCLPIVTMIERNETVNVEGVEVDFEDQETYECLFKQYWEDLKKRQSLVIPELDRNGKPIAHVDLESAHVDLKMEDHTETDDTEESNHDYSEVTWKRTSSRNRTSAVKIDEYVESEGEGEKVSERRDGYAEPEVKGEEEDAEKLGEYLEPAGDGEKDGSEKMDEFFEPESEGEKMHLEPEDEGEKEGESWASAELLDFIEHIEEDPSKPRSISEVNKLLSSYIKSYKLQDAYNSSQINCDEHLRRIFRKQSVERSEMSKELQVHFSAGSFGDGEKKSKDEDHADKLERRRGQRSTDERIERPNSTEFAAITPKNIDLIYSRRALLRELLDDPDFHNKVVGTFVRIRVPTTYRLVLVTGTRIGETSYITGTKTTNILLEILNLQKKEEVTIDIVSSQDFTEEECQRLRQSIKCGFIKPMTVGEVEDKAIALREDKLNHWLESEKMRLSNLRDRASEKGRKKELRECVEKLQELEHPAFRAAKLKAVPEVTSDPHMDPGYESDSNDPQDDTPNDAPEKATTRRFNTSQDSSFHGSGHFGQYRSKKFREDHGRRGGRSRETGRGSALSMDGKYQSRDQYHVQEQDRSRGVDYTKNGVGERLDMNPWVDNGNGGRLDEDPWADNGNGGRLDVDPWADNGNGGRLDVDPWADNGNGGRLDMDPWEDNGKLDVDPWADDSKFSRGETKAGSQQTRPEVGWDVVPDPEPRQIVSASNDFTFSRGEVHASSGQTRPEVGWDVVPDPEPPQIVSASNDFTFSRGEVNASSEQTRRWDTVSSRSGYGVRSDPVVLMSETEKMWNYQDPTGMVHGPFAMEQLRKWITTGFFPPYLTIWRADHDKAASEVLLTDALAGRFRETPMTHNQNADGESGKSTYGRRSNGREYDAPVRARGALSRSRGGSRSARALGRMDVPCRYYAQGYCRRGDVCEFRHS